MNIGVPCTEPLLIIVSHSSKTVANPVSHLLELIVLDDSAFVCVDFVEQLLRLSLGEFPPRDDLRSFLPDYFSEV